MTDQQQHPITPPPELVQQWMNDICDDPDGDPHFVSSDDRALATRAAQWGADQELEACCEWLDYNCPSIGAHHLRAARRPKPPSLKEQALEALNEADQGLNESEWRPRSNTIRRAINQLPDD